MCTAVVANVREFQYLQDSGQKGLKHPLNIPLLLIWALMMSPISYVFNILPEIILTYSQR